MGIEVAEQYGGAGGSLHDGRARRRRDQQDRRGRGDPDRRAEHARQLPDRSLRQRRAQGEVPAAAHERHGRRVRAERAVLRLRRLRHADARRAARRRAGSSTAARCGSPTAPKRRSTSSSPTRIRRRATRASRRSSSSASFTGFSVGKKEDKLGIRASSTTELILDDVEVPAENVLGPVGQGYKIAIETLNEGRIGIGAQMIGVGAGRARGGDGVREGAHSSSASRSPTSRASSSSSRRRARRREAARLMVYNAARLKDAGPRHRDGRRDGEAVLEPGRRARDVDLARAVRRLRLHEGLSGREVLSRREDRRDLRGHEQHAAQTIAKAMLR